MCREEEGNGEKGDRSAGVYFDAFLLFVSNKNKLHNGLFLHVGWGFWETGHDWSGSSDEEKVGVQWCNAPAGAPVGRFRVVLYKSSVKKLLQIVQFLFNPRGRAK